jgi:acyl carrier protein
MKPKRKDIIALLPHVDALEIKDEDNLITQWGLSSIDIIDIVIRIENRYHIVIDISDLTIDNFENIAQINNLIKKYLMK